MNDLIAQPDEKVKATEGLYIVQGIEEISSAVKHGSWAEGALSGFGLGMDIAFTAMDPVGSGVATVVAWVIEHFKPFHDMLDKLAGNPPVIKAHATTWENIAKALEQDAQSLKEISGRDLAHWTGEAAEAFRTRVAGELAELGGLAAAAATSAKISKGAATAVELVRMLVRDLFSQAIGTAVANCWNPLMWIPMAGKIASLVAKGVRILKDLVKSVKNLMKLARDLAASMSKLGKMVRSGASSGESGGVKAAQASGGGSLTRSPGEAGSAAHAAPGGGASSVGHGGGVSAAQAPKTGDRSGSSVAKAGTGGNEAPHPSAVQSKTVMNVQAQRASEGVKSLTAWARRDPAEAARAAESKLVCGDPVDVATGRVLLSQRDVMMPGLFEVQLVRTYDTGYEWGGSFGSGWASSLDERIVVDDLGVVAVRADGSVLLYPPLNQFGGLSLPIAGADRWMLKATGTGFVIDDPLGGVRRFFEFAKDGGGDDSGVWWLSRIEDRAGRWLRFIRSGSGVCVGVQHHAGYEVRVSRDDASRVTGLDVVDVGPVRRFQYDELGRLVEVAVVDPSGGSRVAVTAFEYDAGNRLLSWVDSKGAKYAYAYDKQGRCIWQSAPNGDLSGTFDYRVDKASGNRLHVYTDALGGRTSYLIDSGARVVQIADPVGGVTQTEYDHWDRPTQVMDALGGVTRYEYGPLGGVASVTTPAGAVKQTQYNDAGQVVLINDPEGRHRRFGYDQQGNLVSVTGPTGGITQIEWNDHGQPVAEIGPSGVRTLLQCNPAGLVVELTGPDGGVLRRKYDGLGRLVQITDPAGNISQAFWGADDRLVRLEHPDGATQEWEYDGEGNVTVEMDRSGRRTNYIYTSFDQVAQVTRHDGTSTQYAYDEALRLTSVTSPNGLIWRYEYDAAGRIVAQIDYDGARTEYQYDLVGRMVQRINPAGQTLNNTFDPDGRLVAQENGGSCTFINRNGAGDVISLRGPRYEIDRSVDAAGRPLSETVKQTILTVAGGITRKMSVTGTMQWEHNALGGVTSRVTPAGVITARSMDGAALVTWFAGRDTTTIYDLLGHSATEMNGAVVQQYEWDNTGYQVRHSLTVEGESSGWETHLTRARTGELLRSSTRPIVGNVIAESGTLFEQQLELDPMGRVTRLSNHHDRHQQRCERYSYDAVGNLIGISVKDAATTPDEPFSGSEWVYEGTRLLRAGNESFTYDAAGRTLTRALESDSGHLWTWIFTWDAADRLINVLTPIGHLWEYTYDLYGRRISKSNTHTGETVLFTWNGAVMTEQAVHLPGRDPVTTTWEYSPDDAYRPIGAFHSLSGYHIIVTDSIGTPTHTINQDGTATWTNPITTLWGHKDAATQDGQPLAFPGQYIDNETGLHYNHNRYYCPTTARYLSPDPLGLSPTINPHTYPHNPTMSTDPHGLTPCKPTTVKDTETPGSTKWPPEMTQRFDDEDEAIMALQRPLTPASKVAPDIAEWRRMGGRPLGEESHIDTHTMWEGLETSHLPSWGKFSFSAKGQHLYRGSEVPPDVAFKDGFTSRPNGNHTLTAAGHVKEGVVCTTYNFNYAANFATQNGLKDHGWIYRVAPQSNGIFLNGSRYVGWMHYLYETEVAFEKIKPNEVLGAYKVVPSSHTNSPKIPDHSILGEMTPNSYYPPVGAKHEGTVLGPSAEHVPMNQWPPPFSSKGRFTGAPKLANEDEEVFFADPGSLAKPYAFGREPAPKDEAANYTPNVIPDHSASDPH